MYYYCGIFLVNYICWKWFKNIVLCIYDGVVVDCDVWGNKDIGCQLVFFVNYNRCGVNGEMLICMVVVIGV